jgi:hypothetical protein
LEVDDPRLPARIPTRGTQDTTRPSPRTRTGLSPSTVRRSRRLSLYFEVPDGGLITPHLPCGIRFELYRVRSPLLTISRLISLPAPTEMFQFGAFPILNGSTPKCWDVPLGYLRFIDSLRLPGAYRSLARPSSALEPSHPMTGLWLVLRQTHITS